MRILIAPDKFKGTLTQREAAAAIRRGVEHAARERGIEIEVDECPVADGGEGTLEAISGANINWQRCETRVLGSSARGTVLAEWGLWRDSVGGMKAVIESARAIGLHLIESVERDPLRATTFGLGTLVEAAIFAGCHKVLIGLGGSATIDGGIGMAQCMGWGQLATDPRERIFASATLLQTLSTVPSPPWTRIAERSRIEFIALCDVQSPLLGPRGAARMFGPQKGATPEQVERLEAGLENLVRVCRECKIPCDPDQPGAGAAGGLGFGLATFLGAKLVPGAPYILDLLNFDERCRRADLVITGEGKMDMQTAEGKACAEVAKRAERAGKPCIAVVGTTDQAPELLRQALAEVGIRLEKIHPLTDQGVGEIVPDGCGANRLEQTTYKAVLDRKHTA